MKESLINLLINLLENLKNPGEVKHSQVIYKNMKNTKILLFS